MRSSRDPTLSTPQRRTRSSSTTRRSCCRTATSGRSPLLRTCKQISPIDNKAISTCLFIRHPRALVRRCARSGTIRVCARRPSHCGGAVRVGNCARPLRTSSRRWAVRKTEALRRFGAALLPTRRSVEAEFGSLPRQSLIAGRRSVGDGIVLSAALLLAWTPPLLLITSPLYYYYETEDDGRVSPMTEASRRSTSGCSRFANAAVFRIV
jgi:hypothetical protein